MGALSPSAQLLSLCLASFAVSPWQVLPILLSTDVAVHQTFPNKVCIVRAAGG